MMKRSTDKGSDREKGVFCMPSSPKVQKEIILKTAFELLLCEGYGAINIKTVAQQLGCSTQPISRQFGSMDGFRKELLEYGIEQLGSFFSMEGERVSDIVAGIAQGYVNLAFDMPNLYKYLYMSEHAEGKMGELIDRLRGENTGKVIEMLKAEYDMPEAYAEEYIKNLNYYVHGIASYAAVGFVELSKQEILDRVQNVSLALLKNWREMKLTRK